MFKWFSLIACCLAVSGCITDRAAQSLSDTFATAIARTLGTDLVYTTMAFQRKNGRWPIDYTELSSFVEQSDGLLWLGAYDRVHFSELPDGRLELVFAPEGVTNRVTLKLSLRDVQPK